MLFNSLSFFVFLILILVLYYSKILDWTNKKRMLLLASYISEITVFVEDLFGVKLFDPSVYFISELPSRLMWQDVVFVITTSLLLSFLATLYPAWRASQVAPAEVLRYE